jgi:hypothetical protein
VFKTLGSSDQTSSSARGKFSERWRRDDCRTDTPKRQCSILTTKSSRSSSTATGNKRSCTEAQHRTSTEQIHDRFQNILFCCLRSTNHATFGEWDFFRGVSCEAEFEARIDANRKQAMKRTSHQHFLDLDLLSEGHSVMGRACEDFRSPSEPFYLSEHGECRRPDRDFGKFLF